MQFIVTVSNPFYAPFRGIVASPSTDGGHTLLLPIVVAIIAYALLHLGINALVADVRASKDRDLALLSDPGLRTTLAL